VYIFNRRVYIRLEFLIGLVFRFVRVCGWVWARLEQVFGVGWKSLRCCLQKVFVVFLLVRVDWEIRRGSAS
jgi:hypothetical protein